MIGKTIQQKRKAAGYTQAQLAERLGVTAPAVNRWEKDLSYPDATLLAPLARLLNTDINALFSFYDALSDSERDLIVDRFKTMMFDGKETEALAYIDRILHENPSDGILLKKVADALYGHHMLRRTVDGTIYLDRIIPYYERTLKLSPEYTEEISDNLLNLYGDIGEREKAEEALSRIPDKKIDKKWRHVELLYLLEQYQEVLPEMERQILTSLVDISLKLNLLQNTLDQAGKQEMAQLAQEKNEAFRKLFEIWNGFDALSMLVSSNANKDADGMSRSFEMLLSSQAEGQQVSNCPLFQDAALGKANVDETTTADMISDLISLIGKFKTSTES